MGDVPASPATFNMAFRGQRIVSATLTDLAETQGLPSGAEVVFGGCSAGARGAMVLLDSVASMLPSGATVRGLLDSGLWLDVAPLDSAEMSLMEQAQLAYGLFDPSAVVSAACASAYPTSLWQCIYGVYRMPFVQSNYFINAAQCALLGTLHSRLSLFPPCPPCAMLQSLSLSLRQQQQRSRTLSAPLSFPPPSLSELSHSHALLFPPLPPCTQVR